MIGSVILPKPAPADEFGRFLGPPLFDVPTHPDARGQGRLSVRALEALPEVLRGERSALVIVTTDQGNMAKLLVSSGLRKRQGDGGKEALAPVLILDRFETIDGRDRISWKARGRDTVLFDGFAFDLDTGQVVPEGFGGDICLKAAGGAAGPELTALGTNKLYTFDKPLPAAPASPGHPSAGRAVLPTDFSGRYSLMANGQMSGTLDLSVDPDGMVSGQFRSDRNGSVYPVTGKVAADLPRKITFTIQFPRSEQVYEGLLWTEEKNAFAGTVQILDHPYSFFAIREGASLAADTIDLDRALPPQIAHSTTSWVITIEDAADRYTLEGAPKSAADLSTALAAVVKVHPNRGVVLRVPESMPFERVHRAVRIIREAGIASIRIGPKTANGAPD
jgi:biopolymer transport protein ExbD